MSQKSGNGNMPMSQKSRNGNIPMSQKSGHGAMPQKSGFGNLRHTNMNDNLHSKAVSKHRFFTIRPVCLNRKEKAEVALKTDKERQNQLGSFRSISKTDS